MYDNNENLISAAELMHKDIPATNWVIPGLLPEGLCVMAGKPKSGKSLLALNLALAVSSGSKLLSHFNSTKSSVLYLPYEDSERRIKDRINKMIDHTDDSLKLANLHFPASMSFTKLDKDGFIRLQNILEHSPDIRLVIIDTLGSAVSGTGKNLGMSYLSDYGLWGFFQKYALKNRICFLFLHHTRKMKADYIFDEISGTRGLTGAADVNLVLETKSKTSYLHIQGRDIEEKQYQLSLDRSSFTWHFLGEPSAKLTPEREEIVNLLLAHSENELKVGSIADQLGKDRASISQLLKSMKQSGEIIDGSQYGFYKLPVN